MAMAPAARQVSSSAPPSFRAKKKVGVESPHEAHPPAGPKPQNNGRMTGPPMQKGAGQGSMFANGRPGQGQGAPPRSPDMGAPGPGPRRSHGQPGGAPPMTPNQPQGRMGPARPMGQMQGGHPRGVPTATHMMADGDPGSSPFADTPPIGGMPDDQGDAQGGAPAGDSSGPPQGGGMGGDMPVIKPEAVAYHDDPHSCSGCMYFGQDAHCAVLQMQVSPEGGCNAFEAGTGGDEPDADDMNDPSSGFGGGGGTGAGFTQNPAGTSGSPSLG